eukprot:5847935-Pyramimonas_sp.AAC.1
MTEVQREKGINGKRRGRKQHQEMAQYFDGDLLDTAPLDNCTETVAMKCDPTIRDMCREEEARGRIRGPPGWAQNPLAYKQNPRTVSYTHLTLPTILLV